MPLSCSLEITLSEFESKLKPRAEHIDISTDALRSAYAEFVALGLHRAGRPDFPLPGGSPEWFEFCTRVASASGAVSWLMIQQFASNPFLARFNADPWPTIGGAMGQLRTGKIDVAPTWRDGKVNGIVPWFSGAGIFEMAVLGFFLPDGREAYAAVNASDRPEFSFGSSVPLAGCVSTRNVAVTITDLAISEDQFLQIEPKGSRAACDDQGVLNQVPLSLGVCYRACELIAESPRVKTEQVNRIQSSVDELYQEIVSETGKPTNLSRRHQLRGQATELSMKLARIATMATMPIGLRDDSPANRLYREALFFACVGGQNLVLDTAIDRAFPVAQAGIRLGVKTPA